MLEVPNVTVAVGAAQARVAMMSERPMPAERARVYCWFISSLALVNDEAGSTEGRF